MTWPAVIVSEAHFMKMKLLPQIRPRLTNAAVAVLRIRRVFHWASRTVEAHPGTEEGRGMGEHVRGGDIDIWVEQVGEGRTSC